MSELVMCGASHGGVPCRNKAVSFAYPGAGPWPGPSVEVPLCVEHKAQAGAEQARMQEFIRTVAAVVSNTPLGYTTAAEHVLLEHFADECVRRLRTFLPPPYYPAEEESKPENRYWGQLNVA